MDMNLIKNKLLSNNGLDTNEKDFLNGVVSNVMNIDNKWILDGMEASIPKTIQIDKTELFFVSFNRDSGMINYSSINPDVDKELSAKNLVGYHICDILKLSFCKIN